MFYVVGVNCGEGLVLHGLSVFQCGLNIEFKIESSAGSQPHCIEHSLRNRLLDEALSGRVRRMGGCVSASVQLVK